MIPQKDDIFWKQLVTGKINHNFNFQVAGLLIKRLNLMTYLDNSEENINKAIDEVYNFFITYEKFLYKDLIILLGIKPIRKLLTLEETKEQIEKGKNLIIAGCSKLLEQLPQGNWIGGTSDSFLDIEGGITTDEKLFVNEIPANVLDIKIEEYSHNHIKLIPENAYENGFSIVIVPYLSKFHFNYAQNALKIEGIFTHPIIGWIAGYCSGSKVSKIYNGKNLTSSSQKSVVMHCKLPSDTQAKINIINFFKPNLEYKLEFLSDGFEASEVLVNGKKRKLDEFINEESFNKENPIVANYYGMYVNVSIKEIDNDIVRFYAPVFKNVEYYLSYLTEDYVKEFQSIENISADPIYSCNCILNYKYSNMEGKKISKFFGPSTFGEIAYILLNQTVVYLEIE